MPAIRKHEAFLKDVARVLFKRSLPPLQIKTVEDAARLESLSSLLEEIIAKRNPELVKIYPGECMLDEATKGQGALIKGINNAPYALHPFMRSVFHAEPSELLSDSHVGILFDGGDTAGTALVRDLDPVNPVITDLDDDMMDKFPSTVSRFIGVNGKGEKIARLAFGTSLTIEYADTILKRDGATAMPAPKFTWVIGRVGGDGSTGPEELEEDDDPDDKQSRWIATEVEGIPFLVDRVDLDLDDDNGHDEDIADAREWVQKHYDLDDARSRLKAARACIGTIYDMNLAKGYCLLCCYASRRQEKVGPAFSQGQYVAVSPMLKLPTFNEAIMLTMLRVMEHELLHNLGYKHGSKMQAAEGALWRGTVGQRGFLSALRAKFKEPKESDTQ
jgi:hypothetical protein